MEIDKIKEMLEYRFSLTTELPQKRHIIFWYDSKKKFKDLIDELNLTDVKIIKLFYISKLYFSFQRFFLDGSFIWSKVFLLVHDF